MLLVDSFSPLHGSNGGCLAGWIVKGDRGSEIPRAISPKLNGIRSEYFTSPLWHCADFSHNRPISNLSIYSVFDHFDQLDLTFNICTTIYHYRHKPIACDPILPWKTNRENRANRDLGVEFIRPISNLSKFINLFKLWWHICTTTHHYRHKPSFFNHHFNQTPTVLH